MTQPDSNAITVLIPTFNRRERLRRALESVIDETRIPLEINIFDNASTDDTKRYVTAMRNVDVRIRYFINPINIGARKNYELAFASVRTKYFVPLADDDWLLPNFLFCAWNILQQYDDIGAAIFVTEVRNEAEELITTYPAALDRIGWGRRTPKEHLRDLLTYGHYAWNSILWRSEVLSFMKGNYFCGGLASDVDFQVQVFCKYPVFLVNQPGSVYSTHDTQASRGYNVLSVTGWASLLQRMDRSIHKFNVFELTEYSKLRSLMLTRYRPTWRSTENVSLKTYQIIRLAALVGFRLEDWDFAYSLLAQAPRELHAGDTLSFTSRGNGRSALLAGWGQPEREGTWSIGEISVLKLLIAPAHRPPQISVHCTPFLHPSHPQLDIICTLGNQIEYWQFAIDREPFTPSLTIPPDAIDADNSVTIELDIRNPIAPAACNVNSDTRLLGIMLHSIDAA